MGESRPGGMLKLGMLMDDLVSYGLWQASTLLYLLCGYLDGAFYNTSITLRAIMTSLDPSHWLDDVANANGSNRYGPQ